MWTFSGPQDCSRCLPPHCVPVSSQSCSFAPFSLHPPERLQPAIAVNSCNMPETFKPVSLSLCECVCAYKVLALTFLWSAGSLQTHCRPA